MKSESIVSHKLTSIRRQLKVKEMEQLRSSLRFNNNLILLKGHQQNEERRKELTQNKLFDILKQQNLEELYRNITNLNYSEEEIILQHALEVAQLLQKTISLPLSPLSLGLLVNQFQSFASIVLLGPLINCLVQQLAQLTPGHHGQAVYLWALTTATERFNLIERHRLIPLLPVAQSILKEQLIKEQENYLLVILLKNLSQAKLLLSHDLLISLAEFFWLTKEAISRTNIYLIFVNVIEMELFGNSTKVLVYALAVCLQGRKHVDAVLKQLVPSTTRLLVSALVAYNLRWDCMESECAISMGGVVLNQTLYSFLLKFQKRCFERANPTLDDLELYSQFFKNAPISQTIDMWFKLGTCENIIDSLASPYGTSSRALILIEQIIIRIVNEGTEVSWVLERLKTQGGIVDAVTNCMAILNDCRLVATGEHVLYLLTNAKISM